MDWKLDDKKYFETRRKQKNLYFVLRFIYIQKCFARTKIEISADGSDLIQGFADWISVGNLAILAPTLRLKSCYTNPPPPRDGKNAKISSALGSKFFPSPKAPNKPVN